MAKFWQKKYTSKYTGAEIDAAVEKSGDATKVTANPTLAGTEAALESLQVGDTKYKVGSSVTFQDITSQMITPIAINFMAFLAAANDTRQSKVFNIDKTDNSEIYEAFKTIIDNITNNASGFNYISLTDNTVYFPVFRVKEHAVLTIPFPTGQGSTLTLYLSYNAGTIIIEGFIQKNNSL